MSRKSTIDLVECPRDALQGWKEEIPNDLIIRYLNTLLRVGFHTLDFGSFVSAKAMPQMADTDEILYSLDLKGSKTKLLAIIANTRGAEEAAAHTNITYLGFPFSISDTFQLRNTNSTIEESLTRVEEIQEICEKNGKKLVIYISMAFGNPYGDPYSESIVFKWVEKMIRMGIETISLADTVGVATPEQVYEITRMLVSVLPNTEIGVHLHSRRHNWKEKIDAALKANCRRFDGAMKGIGGCPMANDDLVGNMNTELMVPYFEELKLLNGIDKVALSEASALANQIFGL
ncbi:MAG: hydroxymethylglutaryl-CoA lyase [Chitinophagaceae bacterium]|nr:hydroxymethylglutaryl-CoA lyase [Chitinophagaceae bacterium]